MRLAQPDFSATSCSTFLQPLGIQVARSLRCVLLTRHGHHLVAQNFQLKLQRIAPRRHRQLIDKRLTHPRISVATRSTQVAGTQHQRHRRSVERIRWSQARREFVTANVRPRRKLLAIAVGHQVVAPRDQLALCVEAGLQPYRSPCAVGVVRHVIFARPQQLDRHIDLLAPGKPPPPCSRS